jgi:hypothetical protein
MPLISLGQGDYRRDIYPEDIGMTAVATTPPLTKKFVRELEAELIGAALRYAAVADWFENRPVSRNDRRGELKAMNAFNRVEAELREAGTRLLRRHGHRKLVLQRALEEGGDS